MQKVSKQSLAMIALSILLAISIALTFTFAVLSDKQGATGMITFNNGFTLTAGTGLTKGTDESGFSSVYTFVITPTYANNSITYSVNDSENCCWTIENKNTGTLTVEIETGLLITEANRVNLGGVTDPITASDKVGQFKKTFSTNGEKLVITVAELLNIGKTSYAEAEKIKVNWLTYTLTIGVRAVTQSSAEEWL